MRKVVFDVRTAVVRSTNGVCWVVVRIVASSDMFSTEEIDYTENTYHREDGSRLE